MNLKFKFIIFIIIYLLNFIEAAKKFNNDTKVISPVIFVPGDGGCQLEARLNKPSVVHYVCQKHTDTWFSLWLNMELLVPLVIDCWIDNAKLYYDNVTRTSHNSPGVEIRIPNWGDPETVEWIDPSHASTGSYFKDIGSALVDKLRYERNRNVKGAPYDFRKAPNENENWFASTKLLIEDTYQQNNNAPVTIISHSMGSPMTLLLMQRQSTEWKQKYVKRIISLAGAWAGSVKAVKVFAMGDDLGSYALSGKTLKAQQITAPSLAWLLPSKYFWKDSEILVQSPLRNYTINDLKYYFSDINYPTAWEMRKDNMKYSLDFTSPGVELHCIYGTQVPTVEKLVYKTTLIADEIPKLVTGDGDGTVNIRSLQACNHWKNYQKSSVFELQLPGVDHMKILADPKVSKYIQDILSA